MATGDSSNSSELEWHIPAKLVKITRYAIVTLMILVGLGFMIYGFAVEIYWISLLSLFLVIAAFFEERIVELSGLGFNLTLQQKAAAVIGYATDTSIDALKQIEEVVRVEAPDMPEILSRIQETVAKLKEQEKESEKVLARMKGYEAVRATVQDAVTGTSQETSRTIHIVGSASPVLKDKVQGISDRYGNLNAFGARVFIVPPGGACPVPPLNRDLEDKD